MRVINYFGMALVAGFLFVCGGGSAAGLPADGQGSSKVINGLVVQPDFGKDRNDTVAMVDVDNNGVQDHIDRRIARQHRNQLIVSQAIRMNPRLNQELLFLIFLTQLRH